MTFVEFLQHVKLSANLCTCFLSLLSHDPVTQVWLFIPTFHTRKLLASDNSDRSKLQTSTGTPFHCKRSRQNESASSQGLMWGVSFRLDQRFTPWHHQIILPCEALSWTVSMVLQYPCFPPVRCQEHASDHNQNYLQTCQILLGNIKSYPRGRHCGAVG